MIGPKTPRSREGSFRHRVSWQKIDHLAQAHDAWTVIPDVPISRRKTRHMLFNPTGQNVAQTTELAELFHVIGAHDGSKIIMIFPDCPYPVYITAADRAKDLWRG